MNLLGSNPLGLIFFVSALTLLPLLFMLTTAFLKISMVLVIVRNAIGVQQVPPNMALYGIALAVTLFVMSPVFSKVYEVGQQATAKDTTMQSFSETLPVIVEPLRQFMEKNAQEESKQFFLKMANRLWPKDYAAQASTSDLLIVTPAFVLSELKSAFEIGFLIYIPFLMIDLLVSNLLLALGMQMVSPMTIALPLKILLFVLIDGWGRLLEGLVLTYRI